LPGQSAKYIEFLEEKFSCKKICSAALGNYLAKMFFCEPTFGRMLGDEIDVNRTVTVYTAFFKRRGFTFARQPGSVFSHYSKAAAVKPELSRRSRFCFGCLT
jgi:hypothetical protein